MNDDIGDITKYKTADGYEFPFTLMDPTPGGRNLGRIHWLIDLVFETEEDGRSLITRVVLSATQTRDAQYARFLDERRSVPKLFTLPADTPMLSSYHDSDDRQNFFKSIFSIGKCSEHGAVSIDAYAPDGSSRLVFDHLESSIMGSIWWAP